MKRSEINAVIRKFEALLDKYSFALPPFLSWTPEEWQTKGHEYDEIRDNMLGWDVTDYGMGQFDTLGLALITIRNGNVHNPKYTKCYAEKIMMCDEGQVSPMHFHWNKMEDIINRGGGNVLIRVYNSTKDEDLDKVNDVHVHVDGRTNSLRIQMWKSARMGGDILSRQGRQWCCARAKACRCIHIITMSLSSRKTGEDRR